MFLRIITHYIYVKLFLTNLQSGKVMKDDNIFLSNWSVEQFDLFISNVNVSCVCVWGGGGRIGMVEGHVHKMDRLYGSNGWLWCEQVMSTGFEFCEGRGGE